MTKPEDARVVHNADRYRFELWFRGELVGILGYFDLRHLTESLRIHGNTGPKSEDVVMSFLHTIIVEEFENRSFAALFVRQALDLACDYRWKVRPVCTYVRRFLDDRPEYRDLIVRLDA
ncbi:MAG: N-acetyltransferase [Rhodococcus sp. (in: high G+C Gram-positive bacteria)]|nr:MAG: N-acetyltransferase [Rhodococcus sp. (in: high G+C Gram-positive bacteria)]